MGLTTKVSMISDVNANSQISVRVWQSRETLSVTITEMEGFGMGGMAQVKLSERETEQFAWQIMMPEFGEEAQQKLKASTALVSRIGGLGGPTALYLAMAGIGKLVLAHGGVPEMGHLNRWIFTPLEAVGKVSPVDSTKEHIQKLVPNIEIMGVKESINEKNVEDLVSKVDIVMDCPPWFEERQLLNREIVRQKKPMIEAAMYGMEGYVTTIIPGETPCLGCLGYQNKQWKHPFPVIGAVPAVLGSLAALEAIKVLTGFGTPLKNKLLLFDGKTAAFRSIGVRRNPKCPVCNSEHN